MKNKDKGERRTEEKKGKRLNRRVNIAKRGKDRECW